MSLRQDLNFELPFGNGLKGSVNRAIDPTLASDASIATGAASAYGERAFIGIRVNSSNVLTGLATLMGAFRAGAQYPAIRAPEWQQMIRDETPKGAPYRVQPKRYNLKFEGPSALQEGTQDAAATQNKRYSDITTREMRDIHARMMREGADKAKERNDDLTKLMNYLDDLDIPWENANDFFGKLKNDVSAEYGLGRLQQSIMFDEKSRQGYCEVTMYSDSYYAFFVEEGFLDVLIPTVDYKQTYAMVPLDEMGQGGDYEYLDIFASTQNSEAPTSRGGATAQLPESGMSLDSGVPMVKLAIRDEPISRPGHYMFMKGTNKFMAQFESFYAQELDKMVTLAQDRDIKYDSMVRQFRGISGKGNRGSFLSQMAAQAASNG